MNLPLNFTYDLSAHKLLTQPGLRAMLPKMRRAGVETMYVGGYFYGFFDSTPEEIAAVRDILVQEGFETGIINLPCGHGGNALDPNDPTINVELGEGWKMRKNVHGQWLANSACIEEKMISDCRKANEMFYQMGYRQLFNDDDLRQGHWGPELQGCYCDDCMAAFSERIGRTVRRDEIAKDAELSEAWMDFQCEKVPRFLRETTPEGMRGGTMIMHNGDRCHGLDVRKIAEALPGGTMVRVGEAHFDDRSFRDPQGEASLRASILTHRAQVGNDALCWSESTVYPSDALSPENWIAKMELEIDCGLRNLFLMSGSWVLTDRYWDALIAALPKLRERAEQPIPAAEERKFIWQL